MRSIVTTARLLGHVPSDSNPNKSYDIRLGSDGVVYCSCTAWKMKKWCKHLDFWHKAEGTSTNDKILFKFFKDHSVPMPNRKKGGYDEIIQNGIINGKW